MPEGDVAPEDASVDDLATAIAQKLAEFRREDEMLAEEEKKIKDRRKMLKAEIDKAERMTRSLIPRTRSSKKPEGVNPPVEQPPANPPAPAQPPVQAQPFRVE